jgi:hypothetical protein
MFKYPLKLPDGEPHDPAVFVTAVPNWSVDGDVVVSIGSAKLGRFVRAIRGGAPR